MGAADFSSPCIAAGRQNSTIAFVVMKHVFFGGMLFLEHCEVVPLATMLLSGFPSNYMRRSLTPGESF